MIRRSIFEAVQKGETSDACSLLKSGHWTTSRNVFRPVMPLLSVSSVFLLLSLVSMVTAHPVTTEDEVDSFRTPMRRPWSTSGQDSEDPVMETELMEQWLSSGLDRRRQLGDIEFSNRYSEFLRSKAKHVSMCAFLRRMQGVKKGGVNTDTESVDLLLKQYMCPFVLPWPSDL